MHRKETVWIPKCLFLKHYWWFGEMANEKLQLLCVTIQRKALATSALYICPVQPSKYPMWDSSHIHTHHTINQIRVSQSPPLKSLTSSLGPTLWGSVSEPTQDYQAGSDTICNNPKKSASHICAIPQND